LARPSAKGIRCLPRRLLFSGIELAVAVGIESFQESLPIRIVGIASRCWPVIGALRRSLSKCLASCLLLGRIQATISVGIKSFQHSSLDPLRTGLIRLLLDLSPDFRKLICIESAVTITVKSLDQLFTRWPVGWCLGRTLPSTLPNLFSKGLAFLFIQAAIAIAIKTLQQLGVVPVLGRGPLLGSELQAGQTADNSTCQEASF
jgi:hypothetical protein